MNVNWVKCEGGNWCPFWKVNLGHEHFNDLEGVYVIWTEGVCLYTGQGLIKDRLADHRNEPDFKVYANTEVFATWAFIASFTRNGVENYLFNTLNPILSENCPNAVPIPVNLPVLVD